MSETAEQAALRVARPVMGEIRRLAAAERRVLERVVAEDEDGRPRFPRLRLVQIEDADERAEQGIF